MTLEARTVVTESKRAFGELTMFYVFWVQVAQEVFTV